MDSRTQTFKNSISILLTLLLAHLLGQSAQGAIYQDEVKADSNRTGDLVKVTLPIDGKAASQLKSTLKRIAETAPVAVRDRHVIVLEFEVAGGKTGRGSELGACMSLARFLGSEEMNQVETIAYIPSDRAGNAAGVPSQLNGHAVLVAIAANKIAMDLEASIGNAGIDEKNLDKLVTDVYSGVAAQRWKVPIPLVLSMLDKDAGLFRVQTDKIQFVNNDALRKLEGDPKHVDTTTITPQGETTLLTSAKLDEFGFLGHKVENRSDLTRALQLKPGSLSKPSGKEGDWRAITIPLPSYVDQHTTKWIRRALLTQSARPNAPDLIIIEIDANDGDVDACLNLARYFVDLDSDKVQTVAFVRNAAKGPLGVIALCCDQLIMEKGSKLGGHTELIALEEADPMEEREVLSEQDLEDLRPMIEGLARDMEKDWSLMMAMIDPKLLVDRYIHDQTKQIRFMSNVELNSTDDPDVWIRQGPVAVDDGIDAETAELKLRVAGRVVENVEGLHRYYELDEIPTNLQPSASDRWVEQFAQFLSSPFIAPWLLALGMFFFSSEMSAPGLGVPGFLAAMCFMVFFWSQYLDGNADMLEIMLFLIGAIFIALEIFVIPGFGVFGIGGLMMMIVSLVLASQDFIIPRNSEQLAQIPYSLMPVLGAGMGFFVAIFALRKILPNSPYLNRMLLDPDKKRPEAGFHPDHDPEAIVDWSHLEGATGETVTLLFPAGKARIQGQVYNVITDGRMVDKAMPIVVVEAVGNRVVVRPTDEEE